MLPIGNKVFSGMNQSWDCAVPIALHPAGLLLLGLKNSQDRLQDLDGVLV
jgi:hypothetical protein